MGPGSDLAQDEDCLSLNVWIPGGTGLPVLVWRDNIAAFGGDPDRVTLAGQSAGALSTLALLGHPDGPGLFQLLAAQGELARHMAAPLTVTPPFQLVADGGVPADLLADVPDAMPMLIGTTRDEA